jgi:hypothetical protein
MPLPDPHRQSLQPLPYHHEVVEYLSTHEPEVWRWAAERVSDAGQREALRSRLLRDTYRIEADAHADVHALLSAAMDRLGITAPVTLYQAPGHDMNAMLLYVPGEVHLIVQGPLLERLSSEELLAVFGHELAHYLLWSHDAGRLLVADRVLGDGADSASSINETFRRYALYTELFADRGGALAAGAVGPAVSALVKIQTGILSVDAAAYLRQAAEVEAGDAKADKTASIGASHPETFIRARALALWWDGVPELDAWIDARLRGPLSLERLDLPGQRRLQALTRCFVAHFLSDARLASDAVLAQVRLMFPDWRADEPAADPGELADAFASAHADDSVRVYLNALMLDMALADPDQRDDALLRAGALAQSLGSLDALLADLRRHAGFGKRESDRFKRQLAKEAQA